MFGGLSCNIRKISIFKQLYLSTFNGQVKLQQQCLYSKMHPSLTLEGTAENQQIKKVKKPPIPKITLLSSSDNSISVVTLEEAQHLSKRRDLKLVKLIDLDTKTQRPVYKLMTGAEYHCEDLKQREQRKQEKQKCGFKGDKMLMMKAAINQHDLDINIKKIVKWLTRKYEVRITISGDPENTEPSEKVYQILESNLKDQYRFVQKRVKGSDLKFQIIPPKDDDNKDSKTL